MSDFYELVSYNLLMIQGSYFINMKKSLIVVILYVMTQTALAKPQHFTMDGFMVIEDVSNFSGGIQAGSVVNAIIHSIVSYDFLNTYNSQIEVGILGITYTQNQQSYTGASQKVSNLSAQREIRLAELNYFQDINSWADLRLGIMDIREYLNIYDLPKELINSGFGTNRVMSNSAVATYPYPGFGAILNLKHANYGLGLAVFQGDPQHQSTLFHHGVFFLEEAYLDLQLQDSLKSKLYLKAGFWQYQQPDPTIGNSNIGAYLMAQNVWLENQLREVNTFAQIGYGPNSLNNIPYSITAGMAVRGLIPDRTKDFLSFGFSQIWLRQKSPEVVFELGYKLVFLQYCELKPDLQYIIKPNGNLPNAFAGILRLAYNINGHILQKH